MYIYVYIYISIHISPLWTGIIGIISLFLNSSLPHTQLGTASSGTASPEDKETGYLGGSDTTLRVLWVLASEFAQFLFRTSDTSLKTSD